jgi:hypothetical protein
MPCLSFRNRLRNLRFARPNSDISEQCRARHRTALLDQVVADVLGPRIGNALERFQEELHRAPESLGVSLRIHNLRLCKPNQDQVAQVICDSPASSGVLRPFGAHLRLCGM